IRILIRPAATGFADAGAREAGGGIVAGTVVDVAYRGRGYDHVVGCADSLLTSVFATRPRPRGAEVELALDPEGCNAFPLNDRPLIGYDEEITTVMAASL